MLSNSCFACAVPVDLERMLEAREKRAARQKELLEEQRRPVVCLTLNIPGERKAYPLARWAFDEAETLLQRTLDRAGIAVTRHSAFAAATGYESFWVVKADPSRLKRIGVEMEENHPLGRLWDIDVLDVAGIPLRGEGLGRGERRCLVCGGPVWTCSRSRAHSHNVLSRHAAELIGDYYISCTADRVAGLALRALLYEVCITPKPGLVDRRNSGAHRDMDIFTFMDSGSAIVDYFRDVTAISLKFEGEPERLLEQLRFRGIQAEDSMLLATGGVNTHKGLLFSMGILCAAYGYLAGRGEYPGVEELLSMCGRVAGGVVGELKQDPRPWETETGGRRTHTRYGATGIRGEVAAGFPHVARHGYPVLRDAVGEGHSINDAGVVALLHLFAGVEDTNILDRGGPEPLREIREKVAKPLRRARVEELLALASELDQECIRENLSPGGCADLLAVSLLVYFLYHGEEAGRLHMPDYFATYGIDNPNGQ